ncbi:MAG: F420-dependent glucose-6-phosphate dehydrogenase [Anaerolineae bacterium]|nr:F420-dependent glucose-6-phosphate dehydrogenase [Anaerolineae bacterium]
MKTGITMNPDAPPGTLIQIVKQAEDLGFSYVYVADQGFSRDVYVTLTLLASATNKIHLGPGVTHPYTRHPVVAAVSIASLDEFSGGRAFLGLGAGGSRTLEPLQLTRTNPLQMCREAATIARRLWQGAAVNYQGNHFQLKEAGLNFPVRADIELHWAARGPKMLALGGELADVVMLNGIPHFELENVVKHVRAGAERAGGRKVQLQYAVPLVYDEASRESARMRTVYRLVDSAEHVKAKLGISPELNAEMRRLVTEKGPQAAAHLVSDELLQHFILEGTPDDNANTLHHLFKTYGLDGLTIEVHDPLSATTLLPRAAEIVNRL